MKVKFINIAIIVTIIIFVIIFSYFVKIKNNEKEDNLLHISYDTTRELFSEYNKLFQQYHSQKTGRSLKIYSSHAASAKQARSISEGLKADIATLALSYDIDYLVNKNLVSKNWRDNFSNKSSPYGSVILFLVRKNNPKKIYDWNDLIKHDIEILTPNPKTSGSARWNYLAAYSYAMNVSDNNINYSKHFLRKLYKNVHILNIAARGSVTNFVTRGLGDVLITWENEAFLILDKFGSENFEIIVPSVSVNASLPVAIIDKWSKKNNNYQLAKSYLSYLYSDESQHIIAKHHFRPYNKRILSSYSNKFIKIDKLFTIDDFQGWDYFNKIHFSQNAIFDQIYYDNN